MQAELFATREKNGVYVPADIYDAREKTSLFMTQRVEALEAEVEAVKEAAQQELATTREAAEAAAQHAATTLAAVEQVGPTPPSGLACHFGQISSMSVDCCMHLVFVSWLAAPPAIHHGRSLPAL